MDKRAEPSIGNRIRTLRKRRGLSMRALAEAAGLSTNAISKIERGGASPTVSSLLRISNALDVPIISLFNDEAEEVAIFTRRDHRPRMQAAGALIETLGTGLPDQNIEPFLMTIDPGLGNTADTYTHSGEEFVFCLEGQVEYRVGDRLFRMETGDSLLFEPTLPHSFRNPTHTQARILIIIQEQDPESRRQARQMHVEM